MTKAEKACWTIAVLGAAAVVAPFAFEETLRPLGDVRFAGVMLGALVGLTAFVCVFLFRSRGRALERLQDGRDLLLHWNYTADEWQSFTAEEEVRERSAKWRLFGVVAFFCLVFGLGFPLFDPEDGWIVTLMLLAVLALCALAIVAGELLRKHQLRSGTAEVRLAEDGMLLAGELHVWKGWDARVEEVGVVEGHPPCLTITYSTPSHNHRQITTVRVPIPHGKEAEAADVAARFVAELSHRT